MKTPTVCWIRHLLRGAASRGFAIAFLLVLARPPAARAAEVEKSVETSAEYTNAGEGDMGGNELQSGKPLADGSIDLLNLSGSVGGENAHAGYTVEAGAEAEIQAGLNGVQATAEIGLEAELSALAQYTVGDENFGGGGAAEASLNALLKAEATVGAYIDSKGLTIGVDAKAEAMVSAEASLTLTLTLFGIQTTVTATARGQAGASANASALVTIGFDGNVYFNLGAGATAGVGGGFSFDAAVNAEQLMQNLGFDSLDQLIEWAEQLANDPEALAESLARQAAGQVAGALFDQAQSHAHALAGSAFSLAGDMLESAGSLPGGSVLADMGDGLQSFFDNDGSAGAPTGSGFGGGGSGGGSGGGGSGSGGGGQEQNYKRDRQFNEWSR